MSDGNNENLEFINFSKMFSSFKGSSSEDKVFKVKRVEVFSEYLFSLFKKYIILFSIVSIALMSVVVKSHFNVRPTARTVLHFEEDNAMKGGGGMSIFMGKKESLRDKEYSYMNTIEFYKYVAQKLIKEDEYSEIYHYFKDFINAKKNSFLTSVKNFFSKEGKGLSEFSESHDIAYAIKSHVKFFKEGSDNIHIEVVSKDPDFALEFSKQLAVITKDIVLKMQLDSFREAMNFVDTQKDDVEGKIKDYNQKILSFKDENNVLSSKLIFDNIRQSISYLDQKLSDAQIELEETQFLMKRVNTSGSNLENQYMAETFSNPGLTFIDNNDMEKHYVLKEKEEMLRAKIKSLDERLDTEKERYQFMIEGEEILEEYKKQLNMKYVLLSKLEQQRSELEALKSQISNSVRPRGEGILLEKNAKLPLPIKMIFSMILFSCVWLFGIYYFHEVFSVINFREPLLFKNEHVFGLTKTQSDKKVYLNMAVKNIANQIGDSKVAMTVSPDNRDGKTYLTINLAEYLASQGKKVLVIDTDKSEDAYSYSTNFENKNVKFSKVDLYSDMKDQVAFDEYKEQFKFFDHVLIDTPSLGKSVESLLLAECSDKIIVMSTYMKSNLTKYRHWVRRLRSIHGENVIMVVNKLDKNRELSHLVENSYKFGIEEVEELAS